MKILKKTYLIRVSTLLAFVLITNILQARTWISADGKKNFEGELFSFEPKTGDVSVTLSDGKKLSFNQKILSEKDIDFLKAIGKTSPTSDKKENDDTDKLNIYLLIGQSNMAGRAPFTAAESEPIERCSLLNGTDEWEPAKNPLNIFSTIRKGAGMQKLNPGYSFAQTMLEENPNLSLGLVVNAMGGTKIDQWKKDTRFYKEAIRRAKEAQKTGILKGILWHQGESDSDKPDGYLEKLTAMITDLRTDLEMPDLPFVAGQVNDVPAINDQIAKLPESLPSTSYVSSEGLKAMDRWHFDAVSMKLLGTRYAKEMIKLQAALESN